MGFMRDVYDKDYAANSRETIRRQTIHQFEQARIVDRNPDDPSRPTNSGQNRYALTSAVLPALRSYGTPSFESEVTKFVQLFGKLQIAYSNERRLQQIPLRLPDGSQIVLSPGKHNALQVAIVEEFGPRFASGAKVLYLGDTAAKHVVCDQESLGRLKIEVTEHDKLPDIILFDPKRNWVFLIEAVISHGPVSPKRHAEIERMMRQCTAGRVYVSAFLDQAGFRKFLVDIAWETEVWIAAVPDHLIHFNGVHFFGPNPPRLGTLKRDNKRKSTASNRWESDGG